MNISKFIKNFVLVFCATTAVASFGTEPLQEKKERLEKEEQKDNSFSMKAYRLTQKIFAHEAIPLCVSVITGLIANNYCNSLKETYNCNNWTVNSFAADHPEVAYYGINFLITAISIASVFGATEVKNWSRKSLKKHERIKKNRAIDYKAVLTQMEKTK